MMVGSTGRQRSAHSPHRSYHCSALHILGFVFPLLLDGGAARMLRFTLEPSMEIAEVIHRRLQTSPYCVASQTADPSKLQTALNWACGSGTGQGNVDCSAINQGGSCYQPNTLINHANYAFNSYYVAQNGATNSCDFGGLATPTSTNPSNGTCIFQALGSGTTTTSPSPTTTTTNSTLSPPTTSLNNTSPLSPQTATGTTSSATPPGDLHWIHIVCALMVVLLLSPRL